MEKKSIKGRGAQLNTDNKYAKYSYDYSPNDGVDEEYEISSKTTFIEVKPKSIVNEVKSLDVPLEYSLNPYQGCEHGCVYCYARNSHEYWGYSAGLDFEQKILFKPNAVELLEKKFQSKNWKVKPIMLSGNTDCYQPIEKEKKLTRGILELCLKYKHPVGIITKNKLVTRDIDILAEMAKLDLVNVNISINSLNEEVRRKLEPRTATYKERLHAMELLSAQQIPVNALLAPIIPGINDHDIPAVLKATVDAGARSANYIVVRLNGQLKAIFSDWLEHHYPDRYKKVLHQIEDLHGGKVNDTREGVRMSGEGKYAELIRLVFQLHYRKHFGSNTVFKTNCELFTRSNKGQLGLF